MSELLDLHPDGGHPLVLGLVGLHTVLDDVLAADLDARPLASGDWSQVLREVERATSRLAALRLRMIGRADTARVAAEQGLSGTDAWVARTTPVSRVQAARDVALAAEMATTWSATREALAMGALSPAHADVIVAAGRRLPTGLSEAHRAGVEADLVRQARRLSPERLRRAAHRALAAVEPDPEVVDAHENALVTSEEDSAHHRARLWLHDNGDGTTSGRFTVPTLAAAALRTAVEAITSPRRLAPPTDVAPSSSPRPYRQSARGRDERTRSEVAEDWAHRRGSALTELLEHLPTDHLHTSVAATVVVTLDVDVLGTALRVAGLDTGESLSAGEARRLACTAGVLPAVLGGASQVLDLGRRQRLFTNVQRTALAARHTRCAADGCDRPYAWCELHHRRPWSRGGATDLDNAVPLCGHHHRLIHHHGWSHDYGPEGVVFHRRD